MSKKEILSIIVSISLLCLILSSLLLRAQSPVLPNPDFVHALWVAKSDGIDKIDTADGSALLQTPGVKNVRAIAVDDQRGVLWAYIQNTLWAYHFNGKPGLSVPLAPHGDDGNGNEVALELLPSQIMSRIEGSTW